MKLNPELILFLLSALLLPLFANSIFQILLSYRLILVVGNTLGVVRPQGRRQAGTELRSAREEGAHAWPQLNSS